MLVTRETLQPVQAIELDDPSHQPQAARARDAFKDQAMASVGLPGAVQRQAGGLPFRSLWRSMDGRSDKKEPRGLRCPIGPVEEPNHAYVHLPELPGDLDDASRV